MQIIQQLAIIGSTASGKTSLAIKVAHKMNAHILSLDSLAIYKEVDIVSAKPTIKEREGIRHFGIDELYPNETFNVSMFISLYNRVYHQCIEEEKSLIIVGGTSFYLKMLIDGISTMPKIGKATKIEASKFLHDLETAYEYLYTIDPDYMGQINPKDTYRIEKALHIYLETSLTPTNYFKKNPPKPAITKPLPIYNIVWKRDILRERIALRTKIMIRDGLIDEVCRLEKKYSRNPNCMKSIGIKETLEYLDGKYDKKVLLDKISTNTARLAKRQVTFNNSQFDTTYRGTIEMLERTLL
jgi:tRNA dimethylallyltransferase